MDKKIITMVEIEPGHWMSLGDIHRRFGVKEREEKWSKEMELMTVEMGKTFLLLSWLVIVAVVVASICWPA